VVARALEEPRIPQEEQPQTQGKCASLRRESTGSARRWVAIAAPILALLGGTLWLDSIARAERYAVVGAQVKTHAKRLEQAERFRQKIDDTQQEILATLQRIDQRLDTGRAERQTLSAKVDSVIQYREFYAEIMAGLQRDRPAPPM